MKSISSVFLIITLFFLSALPTMAQTEIYAIQTTSNNIETLPMGAEAETRISPFLDSALFLINPGTGQPAFIGPITGYTQCTGLDIHPETGQFFAVCDLNGDFGDEVLLTRNGVFGPHLLTLDPTTGQPTDIGELELSRGDSVSDISFRSDGTLFAHLNASGFVNGDSETTTNTINANSLAIIDTNNANVTILGETGIEDFFSAIGFTGQDILLQCTDNQEIDNVVNVLNQNNGSASFLENLIFPAEFDNLRILTSKDFDLFSGHFFAILISASDRELAEAVTNNIAPEGNFLTTINPDNGQVEVIGPITLGLDEQYGAIAVLAEPQPIAEVPTLSEYGLIVTVVMLLGAAVLVLRRRQVKTEI